MKCKMKTRAVDPKERHAGFTQIAVSNEVLWRKRKHTRMNSFSHCEHLEPIVVVVSLSVPVLSVECRSL
jgi:hypothetical protein